MAASMVDVTERMRRLREEWELAPHRAALSMARVASAVHTDRTIPRDHLDTVLDAIHDLGSKLDHAAGGADYSTRGRFVLGNDVAIFLNGRRGRQRPFDQRLREAQDRLRRGLGELDHDDPEIWRLRVREAEARASLPDLREQALVDLDRLLAEAGYPEQRNYRLSLHAMNLAVKLRADDDDARAERSEQIVEAEAAWRRQRYSARHPFTLVARANGVLYTLTRLEYAADRALLSPAQSEQVRAVVADAASLHAHRAELLGERSSSAVRALSFQARALRLLGDHERSRAIAAEAYALRGDDPETSRDDEVPAILQICMASAVQARREVALRNADLARRKSDWATDELERGRATRLAQEVVERLDAADDVLAHQVPYRHWVERSRRIRASAG
jgi:hypothetical protein